MIPPSSNDGATYVQIKWMKNGSIYTSDLFANWSDEGWNGSGWSWDKILTIDKKGFSHKNSFWNSYYEAHENHTKAEIITTQLYPTENNQYKYRREEKKLMDGRVEGRKVMVFTLEKVP